MQQSCNIVASPCSTPKLDLEPCLKAFADLGYRQFEAFTSWAKSAVDVQADPGTYRALAASCGMTFSSMHLPPVKGDDFDATLAGAIAATKFAAGLGASVVLFKASDRPTYIRAAGPYLDATASLGVTPVLQNHAGTAISTLADFAEVIDGIGDPRMKTLLEVGHFLAVGVSWKAGYDLLGDSIALVHIKDMRGKQSVPFGTGEVDLSALFTHMQSVGYAGNFVVEMEVADPEHTLQYLGAAHDYLRDLPGVHL